MVAFCQYPCGKQLHEEKPNHAAWLIGLGWMGSNMARRQRYRVVAARLDGGCSGQRFHAPRFARRVSDSGEGRWTIKAAVDEGVPAPVLTTALYARFSSRGDADFQNKLLSAMRQGLGGHREKSAK